jgi:acetyl-CoA acetyltransferase
MNDTVSIIGVGMTPMSTRDLSPEELASVAASEALADAGLRASEVGLVLCANALGGSLNEQACIRGQAWLGPLGLDGVGVINVDNSCASGGSAFHLGVMSAGGGQSPVLVVGAEKMWTGSRIATLHAIEEGLPAAERLVMRDRYAEVGSTLMGMNSVWVNHQVNDRGTTVEQIAAAAVKARKFGAMNPLAQHRKPVTIEEVLESPVVAAPLRRLMCSSFTDGAAAVVLASGKATGSPKVLASVVRSGTGDTEYHERLGQVADEGWKAAGVGPSDLDLVEIHDATSAEELYALEAMGFFAPGDAGVATLAGATGLGGDAVCVNPSGGLVARGHPIGATGLCQIVEIVHHLRGRAGSRQVQGASLGAAVNTGGLINADPALVSVAVFEKQP